MELKGAELSTGLYGSGLMEKNAWETHTWACVPTAWLLSFLQRPADTGGIGPRTPNDKNLWKRKMTM